MRSQIALPFIVCLAMTGCTAIDEMTNEHPVRAPGFQPGYEVAANADDTVESVAQRFNVPSAALIRANHLRPPYAFQPHQLVIIPPPATYRVRDGDTVADIAASLGVDEVALAQANGLSQPYHMRVGQVLKVPGGYGADEGPSGESEADYAAPALPPRSSISAQPLAPPPTSSQPLPPPPAPAMAPPPRFETPPMASAPRPVPAPAVAQSTRTTVLAAPPPKPSVSPTALAPQPGFLPANPPPARPSAASSQPMSIVPPAAVAPPPSPPAQAAQPEPRPPATQQAVATGSPHFIRPVSGQVSQGFGPDGSGQTNDGINITAQAGSPVKAADAGTVIYTGNELAAFGNLVLIRHAGGWVTAYGHLASIDVQRGATVSQGQSIGTVGQTGSAAVPQLHFEIRQGSKPVDPAPYLSPPKG